MASVERPDAGMAAGDGPDTHLSFAEACAFLALPTKEFARLRDAGLVVRQIDGTHQRYPVASLRLTRHLLRVGAERGWGHATLCWYADLLFAAQIGLTILIPGEVAAGHGPAQTWLESPLVAQMVADDPQDQAQAQAQDRALATGLRAIVGAALQRGQPWPTTDALRGSALAPIITHLEAGGAPIVGAAGGARVETGATFFGIAQAFSAVGAPLSDELRSIIAQAQVRLRDAGGRRPPPPTDQEFIAEEGLIAVDRLYAGHITEIHAGETGQVEVEGQMVVIPRRTVALQLQLVGLDTHRDVIDNIVDAIRPFLGPFGARVVHLLYEIANDAPYWRQPIVEVDSNELLDRLGLARDKRQIHYTDSRRRLRDTLTAAHNLEIVGERPVVVGGRAEREAFRQTVLSVIGGYFDADETRGISTADLFRKGLPRRLVIRLNFYEGVRRADGMLGTSYVLMPRLPSPQALESAAFAGPVERLQAYLLSRFRQDRPERHTLTFTRQEALDRAGIRDSHVTRAGRKLGRALTRLADAGLVATYEPIPLQGHETFQVTLNPLAARGGAAERPTLP